MGKDGGGGRLEDKGGFNIRYSDRGNFSLAVKNHPSRLCMKPRQRDQKRDQKGDQKMGSQSSYGGVVCTTSITPSDCREPGRARTPTGIRHCYCCRASTGVESSARTMRATRQQITLGPLQDKETIAGDSTGGCRLFARATVDFVEADADRVAWPPRP